MYQPPTRRCLATMVETDALTEVEPNGKRIHLPDVMPLVKLKKRSPPA